MERYGWEPMGSITVAHAALTNAQRKVKDIDTVVGGTNSLRLNITQFSAEFLELRFHGVASDGDVEVIEFYSAQGVDDDYTHIGQLTITFGTMIVRGGTKLYIDTIVYTSEKDSAFELSISNSTNNDTAKLWLNTNGYNRFLIVASTHASTSLVAEAKLSDRRELPAV